MRPGAIGRGHVAVPEEEQVEAPGRGRRRGQAVPEEREVDHVGSTTTTGCAAASVVSVASQAVVVSFSL